MKYYNMSFTQLSGAHLCIIMTECKRIKLFMAKKKKTCPNFQGWNYIIAFYIRARDGIHNIHFTFDIKRRKKKKKQFSYKFDSTECVVLFFYFFQFSTTYRFICSMNLGHIKPHQTNYSKWKPSKDQHFVGLMCHYMTVIYSQNCYN